MVTVGQAIRREVAAMGDGVERALARASELETLVRNEVAALERTYGDNEVRIRGLLQDLANQRDTLVGQAEQVRSAINNVHIDLTQDLSTISDLVGQQVNEAAERITHSLAEKGEHITLALGEIGDNMIQQLSVRGEDLIVRLEAASEETSRALATASDQLTTSLNFKTDHIGEEFSEIARGLEDMMASRLDGVTDRLLGEVAGHRRHDGRAVRRSLPTRSSIPRANSRKRSPRAPTRSTPLSRPPVNRSSSTSICAAATSPRNSKRPAPASPRR